MYHTAATMDGYAEPALKIVPQWMDGARTAFENGINEVAFDILVCLNYLGSLL